VHLEAVLHIFAVLILSVFALGLARPALALLYERIGSAAAFGGVLRHNTGRYVSVAQNFSAIHGGIGVPSGGQSQDYHTEIIHRISHSSYFFAAVGRSFILDQSQVACL